MSLNPSSPIYPGSSFKVLLSAMKGLPIDGTPDVFLNAGTATWTLQKLNGTYLANGTIPYLTGSDGNYAGLMTGAQTLLAAGESSVVILYNFVQGGYEIQPFTEQVYVAARS